MLRSARLGALIWSFAAVSCSSDDAPLTQMVVVVDSDIDELDRVQIRVLDHDGHYPALRQRDIRVGGVTGDGKYSLPLSFALSPEDVGAIPVFRLVIVGYEGGKEVVKQQVIQSFKRNKSLRLEVILSENCLDQLCDIKLADREGTTTCEKTTGECDFFPENEPLPEITSKDALAGYVPRGFPPPPPTSDGGPPEEVCSFCTLPGSYPCSKFDAHQYTCVGQIADWHMPDATEGAKYAPSYDFDSNQDVVVDHVTGLKWQRLIPPRYAMCAGEVCDQLSKAKDYCNQLILGDLEWRLPSYIELASIFDPTQPDLPIDHQAFPETPRGTYWTVSLDPDNGTVRTLRFGAGGRDGIVRCVSSEIDNSGTPEHYSTYLDDEEDKPITRAIWDSSTELGWQKDTMTTLYTWETAKAFCERQGSQWRLPTLNELMTLVDFTRSGPALDVQTFGAIRTNPPAFWSSSRAGGMETPEAAWFVDFTLGEAGTSPVSEKHLTRCVRNVPSVFDSP